MISNALALLVAMLSADAPRVAATGPIPVQSLHLHLGSEDYPSSAIRDGAQGTVSFRLTVGPNGAVAGCAVTATSGNAVLDETTCRIMSVRPRFSPARDAAGKAVSGTFDSRIRWSLPSEAPVVRIDQNPPGAVNLSSYLSMDDYPEAAILNGEQGLVSFRITISPEGGVADCVITRSSGSALLDATTCRIIRERARFRPARDSAGNPVSDTMESRIRWVLPE